MLCIQYYIENMTLNVNDLRISRINKSTSLCLLHLVQGPFDVCRKVFVGGEETRGMTLNDKSDLFFHDYNIAPLFVQENYVHVIPYAAK